MELVQWERAPGGGGWVKGLEKLNSFSHNHFPIIWPWKPFSNKKINFSTKVLQNYTSYHTIWFNVTLTLTQYSLHVTATPCPCSSSMSMLTNVNKHAPRCQSWPWPCFSHINHVLLQNSIRSSLRSQRHQSQINNILAENFPYGNPKVIIKLGML